MIKSFGYSAIAALTITVTAPINIIDANKADFNIIHSTSFLTNLITFYVLLWVVLLLFFSIVLKLWKGFEKALFFLIAVVLVWSLYLPLPIGTLDGIDAIMISQLNLFFGPLQILGQVWEEATH